jgi:hypothetical protein
MDDLGFKVHLLRWNVKTYAPELLEQFEKSLLAPEWMEVVTVVESCVKAGWGLVEVEGEMCDAKEVLRIVIDVVLGMEDQ